MLLVLTPAALWIAAVAARAVWRAWRAVPKRNADFGFL